MEVNLHILLSEGLSKQAEDLPKHCPSRERAQLRLWRGFCILLILVWVLPVDADGDEVEDGGGAADDVEGDVEVAHHLRQAPHPPVHLQGKRAKRIHGYPLTMVIGCRKEKGLLSQSHGDRG